MIRQAIWFFSSQLFSISPAACESHEYQEALDERGAIREEAHLCMEATGPYSETLATNLVEMVGA